MRRASEGPPLPILVGLLAIMLLGTWLRCRYLGAVSLWFDESFSWKMSTFDWAELWGRVARDNHPPLYFFLLKAWTSLWGDSVVALRSLSVIFGAASVAGGFFLVRDSEWDRAYGPARQRANVSGLLAALGLALSVLQVEWSQEVRMYSLGCALTLWSSWWLIRILQHPQLSLADVLIYVALGSALSYTHYYCLFILVAHFLYACGVCWRWRVESSQATSWKTPAGMLLCGFVLIGMLWLPWLPNFLAHRQQVEDEYWTRPLSWLEVQRTCWTMWCGAWTSSAETNFTAWGVTVLSFIYWMGLLGWGRGGTRLMGLVPLVSFACAAAASWNGRNILFPRYFIFAHTLVICGLAVGIQRIPQSWLRETLSVLGLLALACLLRENDLLRKRATTSRGYAAAIEYLEQQRNPGEPIFVSNPEILIDSAVYLHDRDHIWVVSGDDPFPFYRGTAVIREREYFPASQLDTLTCDRLWVIDRPSKNLESPRESLPETWKENRSTPFLHWYAQPAVITVKEYLRAGQNER